MPSLSVPMNPICDATFVAQNKRLPVDWKQPQGEVESGHYRDAFDTPVHMGVPIPGCYFWAQSTLELHVETCKKQSDFFKNFCHSMLSGFKQAVDQWRTMAQFQGLTVNGPVLSGTPGCLTGPDIRSSIKSMSLPAAANQEKAWRDAVANGLADCWKAWQMGVSVPGLPLYPAFTAFPGPMAPPMPNIPCPLISCPSSGLAQMQSPALKSAMIGAYSLSSDTDGQFAATATAIASAVSAAFLAWLPMQQITNVMSTGAIPTFAPPVAPVGPVVMGNNMPGAGHLAA